MILPFVDWRIFGGIPHIKPMKNKTQQNPSHSHTSARPVFDDETWNCWGAASGLVSQHILRKVPNPTSEKCWVEISWLLGEILDVNHKFWCKPFALKPHPHYPWILTFLSHLLPLIYALCCSPRWSIIGCPHTCREQTGTSKGILNSSTSSHWS